MGSMLTTETSRGTEGKNKTVDLIVCVCVCSEVCGYLLVVWQL